MPLAGYPYASLSLFTVMLLSCSGNRSLGNGLPSRDAGVAYDAESGNGCSSRVAIDAGTGLTKRLLAWYRCEAPTDSSSTVLSDSGGYGNDGALMSGAASSSGYGYGPGKVSQALRFSSANQGYATLPSNLLAGACEATVATWVYLNSAGDWQRVFDFGKPESDGTSKIYMYLTAQGATNKGLHFAISTAGVGPGEQTMEGPSVGTKGWHHVAVVLGPAGGTLYLDGLQVGGSASLTLRPADLPHPLDYLIARSQWRLYDYYLDGNIDEFRVYDRALGAEEIQSLSSGGS
jgi:hypothetical protein